MRLGPVCTNSMVGLAHLLLFIWPPSVLSTRLVKSVYFLLGETVGWTSCAGGSDDTSSKIEVKLLEHCTQRGIHILRTWPVVIQLYSALSSGTIHAWGLFEYQKVLWQPPIISFHQIYMATPCHTIDSMYFIHSMFYNSSITCTFLWWLSKW